MLGEYISLAYALLQTALSWNFIICECHQLHCIIMTVCTVLSALLVAMLLQFCNSSEEHRAYYTTKFMVQIDGNHKMADKLARVHGMKNMGSVSYVPHFQSVLNIIVN